MIKKLTAIAFFLIAFTISVYSQSNKYDQSDSAVAARLKVDVSVLASDSLEGREAGTEGEAKAKQYIVSQFKEIGLKPLFKSGTSYFQPFDVNGGADYGTNIMSFNTHMFVFKEDFYPLDFSADGNVKGDVVKVGYGISAPDMKYDDYKDQKNLTDKICVMELYIPDSLKKIRGVEAFVDPKVRAKTAMDKGATGVIFINSDADSLGPPMILSGNTNLLTIPAVFADKQAAKMIKVATNIKAEIEVNVDRNKCKMAYNVGGYIDNKAKFTVVFGGHYDHLGFTISKGKKLINYGADDNASGTAAMMELARYFSDTTKEKYNLVFLAFSAEEKGLLGSKYFVESNAIDLSKVAFMINCDMMGRMDSVKKAFTIYSAGSSPAWKKIIAATDADGLKVNPKQSVESGSDHYNFYKKNIADVFFFTELHADYHTPADVVSKVNFAGEAQLVKYIERFFNGVTSGKKLTFERANIY